jgi:uncharacterized RDD family membrane protein YckC
MTERPNESGGLSSGDPLRGPEAPAERPGSGGIWSGGGYGPESPPPPGAGGMAPVFAGQPAAGRHVLADWWRRVVAQLIDGLIVAGGALLVLLVVGAVFSIGFLGGDDDSGWVALVVGLVLWALAVAVAALVYAPWLMSATNGKTLGRMATNIRVVRTDGQRITFGFAMLREVAVKALLFGIAGSITFGIANLLDWLWPLWDEENRALHDFIVSTRTVMD